MKILTLIGTRPEIIRLSRIIQKLDRECQQILVHTNQNYDKNLNDIFMSELKVRDPDYNLKVRGSIGQQIGILFSEIEKILLKERPDRFLVLGDTNSSLAAFIAKRMGISVYHMEAGNRSYDDRVPEEVNRRIIDHSSDVLLPYTHNSKNNLLKEGISEKRIIVTGNPIYEVLQFFGKEIESSNILKRLRLIKNSYFLATLHRAENVDTPERLKNFVSAFDNLTQKYDVPLIWSLHPRTKKQLENNSILVKNSKIKILEPMGFFDFVKLEKNAFCVLSDSGTVQEECCIMNVSSVTLRDVTERPETIAVGSSLLSGSDTEKIMKCVSLMLERKNNWNPPPEYLEQSVSDTVIKLLLQD